MNQLTSPTAEKVLSLLSELTGLPDLHEHLDLDLFQESLLDSLSIIRLLVSLSSEFGIEMNVSDFDRELMATPRLIIAFVETHAAA